jgi:hypothetical protein
MFMGPLNWFQEMDFASLGSLAGRYDNPIPPRFLAPIDFLKIPAQFYYCITGPMLSPKTIFQNKFNYWENTCPNK